MELKIEHLSKQFKDKTAVNDVNLTLTPGVWGLLGANGAGKTTLMRMIADIMTPIICVYILGDSFLLQTSGSIKEVQNRMNWLSAARRQKKKSRRRADTFSRAYETAALIFRAAVSLHLHKPMMNFPEILWLIAI